MHLLLDNFWKILLLVVIAVAGWFTWQWKRGESAYDRRVNDVAFILNLKESKFDQDTDKADARYWRALKKINDYSGLIPAESKSAEGVEKGGMKGFLADVGTSAVKSAGNENADLAKALADSLQQNYDTCKTLNIFSNQQNAKAMSEGQAPTIPGEGVLTGEKLCLMRKVPGYFAREARNHPTNFIVVPAPFANARMTVVDKFVNDSALQLKRVGVVAGSSQETINRWNKQSE